MTVRPDPELCTPICILAGPVEITENVFDSRRKFLWIVDDDPDSARLPLQRILDVLQNALHQGSLDRIEKEED